MTTTLSRDTDHPLKKATPRRVRTVETGKVEQRLARGHSKAVAVEAKRRRPSIRAWHAADSHGAQPLRSREERTAGTAAPRTFGHMFARETAAGGRLSAHRATRMRAIEQAWKEERARQAQLEAEEARAEAEANR